MYALNTQLLLNAAEHVCQPSNVLVPETLPQDFVEISDDSEIQNQPGGKKDDYLVTGEEHSVHVPGKVAITDDHVCQPIVLVPETLPQDFVEISDDSEVQNQPVGKKDDCSVTCDGEEHDVHRAGKVAVSTSHMQPSTFVSCSEKTSPGSPVFNRHCAAPVPVSSSPSLFDEEEEKRLHQRNANKILSLSSGKKFAAISYICTDVSQPSPSVLSRKLCVNASVQPENEQNKYNMNVDHQQPVMLTSELRSMVNYGDGLQTINKVKCKDNVDYTGSGEMLPNELDVQKNAVDDRFCYTQTVDVNKMPANNGIVASDMLEVSATGLNGEQNNLLEAVAKPSQSEVEIAMCEAPDCQQPLPKKQRFGGVNSGKFLTPHAVDIDNNVEDSGKFFSDRIFPQHSLKRPISVMEKWKN